MNLLLVEASEIDDRGRVMLRDRRADHLRKVLKVEPGRVLRVGKIGGLSGRAKVLAIDGREILLEVEIPEGEVSRGAVDVIVGLPRPQALHRLLQTAAVMGVDRLDLVNAWRVEKSFFQSPSLSGEKMEKHLRLGAEQGRTTRLPEVTKQPLLVPYLRALEDTVPTLRLIADPDAELLLEDAVAPELGQVERFRVAVGPEGGWIDREVQTFGEEGFVPVRLGPWILKVDNAVTAVLGQLALVRRAFGRDKVGKLQSKQHGT